MRYITAINKNKINHGSIAIGAFAINILNMLTWVWGVHISPLLFILVIVTYVLMVIFGKDWNGWIVLFLFLLFTIISLGWPLIAWDARSIWFFHAKRIFFDNGLYAQLDKYAPFSHNDYPVLVPSLAASLAKSVGYWNEIYPKLSIVETLFPIYLVFAFLFKNDIFFAIFVGSSLFVCKSFLLNGYMDAILALYCAAAVVLLYVIYSEKGNNQGRSLDLKSYLLFFIALTLPFIKNEGLLAALLIYFCLLPRLIADYKLLVLSILSLAFYFILWRYPLINHHIHTDLFVSGVIDRGIKRLSNFSDMYTILKYFVVYSGGYFFILFASIAILNKNIINKLPSLLFIIIYCFALIVIYVITPDSLIWHLNNSADRTFMVVNMCITSFVVYLVMIYFNAFRNKSVHDWYGI